MVDSQVIAFAGIAAVLTVTPGADTMLILRNLFSRGPKAGVLTMIGICSGLFIHAVLSALGLSLMLVRSATAFEIVKFLGACYLIFLGAQSVWRATRQHSTVSFDAKEDDACKNESWKVLLEGMLTNLLNPKVAIFYLAFLPQFINPQDWVFGKSILLAGIHFTLGVIWYSILIFSLGHVRSLFERPRIRQVTEIVSGVILIGFGLRLATEKR